MGVKSADVDDYLAACPDETRDLLQQVREVIRKALPEATELISYGIPAFRLQGQNIVYFAGWQKYIAMYPLPTGNAALQKRLAPYTAGRGTLHFPLDAPLPLELIREVVARLLEDRQSHRAVPRAPA